MSEDRWERGTEEGGTRSSNAVSTSDEYVTRGLRCPFETPTVERILDRILVALLEYSRGSQGIVARVAVPSALLGVAVVDVPSARVCSAIHTVRLHITINIHARRGAERERHARADVNEMK